jgi:hypothetical protein
MEANITKSITTASHNNRPLSIQGLSEDEIQLRAQGHVGEMPRQFGLLSGLSLGFSITNSWAGFAAVLATPLLAGGGPSVIYALLVATIACSFINAGLAELSSAFPSSGGQYQSGSNHLHPSDGLRLTAATVSLTWSRPPKTEPRWLSPAAG